MCVRVKVGSRRKGSNGGLYLWYDILLDDQGGFPWDLHDEQLQYVHGQQSTLLWGACPNKFEPVLQ